MPRSDWATVWLSALKWSTACCRVFRFFALCWLSFCAAWPGRRLALEMQASDTHAIDNNVSTHNHFLVELFEGACHYIAFILAKPACVQGWAI